MPGKRGGGGGGGFDIGLLFAHKLILVTFALSFIGWFVAFIGQIVAEASSTIPTLGYLWFAIFLEFFLIAGMTVCVITDSLAMARLQLTAFTAVALVFAVQGIDRGIYSGLSSLQALAAGYLLMTVANLIWLLYLTSEDDSPVMRLMNNLNGGLSSPASRGAAPRGGGGYGGAMGNASSHSAGYSVPQAAGGYAPAYGHSPSAADLTTSNGVGLNPPKVSTSNSMRAGASETAEAAGPPSVASHTPGSPGKEAQDYGYKARALYAYQANADDPTEISFSKGEVLDIVDNSGKWWQARKANGETGIVPSNYMQLL